MQYPLNTHNICPNISSSGKEMLVEHNTASERPDSHESRFHKEEFPFFWVVNVYAKYTQ